VSSTAIPSLEGVLSRQLSAVGTQHHSTAKDATSQVVAAHVLWTP
jgi:hypothetical protein